MGEMDWNYPTFDNGRNDALSIRTITGSVYDPTTGTCMPSHPASNNLYFAGDDDSFVDALGNNYLVMSSDDGETWNIINTFPGLSPDQNSGRWIPAISNIAFIGAAK